MCGFFVTHRCSSSLCFPHSRMDGGWMDGLVTQTCIRRPSLIVIEPHDDENENEDTSSFSSAGSKTAGVQRPPCQVFVVKIHEDRSTRPIH
jgi:hypothetical protein